MDIAIGQYIRLKDFRGNYAPARAFQNFFVGETRTWEGVAYTFAPFGISGTTSSRNGDGVSGTLVSVPNDLTVGVTVEATLNRWLIEVRTVHITCTEDTAFNESATLAIETWNIASFSQESDKITLTLASPLDATKLQVPKRVLCQYLVGAVPATGTIYSS